MRSLGLWCSPSRATTNCKGKDRGMVKLLGIAAMETDFDIAA
jgi:hypothetical protein